MSEELKQEPSVLLTNVFEEPTAGDTISNKFYRVIERENNKGDVFPTGNKDLEFRVELGPKEFTRFSEWDLVLKLDSLTALEVDPADATKDIDVDILPCVGNILYS